VGREDEDMTMSGSKLRAVAIALVPLLCLSAMGSLASVNASAATRALDFNCHYHVAVPDGGENTKEGSGSETDSGGYSLTSTPPTAYAETEAWPVGTATRYVGIWAEFKASAQYDGVVDARLTGLYRGEVWSECPNPFITDTDAYLYWYVRVCTVGSGGKMSEMSIVMIDRVVEGGFGVFHSDTGVKSFDISMRWWAAPGTTYRIEAYMKCHASTGTGHAHAAGNNDRGIFWSNLDVYCQTTGCVAEGTLVTMADGSQKAIERIRAGDIVRGYDLETDSFVAETVQSVSSTKVPSILDINHGALLVTATDQPIYVRNSSGEGWVQDPQDIQIGWEILDLVSGSWVQVVSVEELNEKTKVYDIFTNGPQNYLANGYLVLDKKRK